MTNEHVGTPIALRCESCGDYASLGPSADDDERVKVEMSLGKILAEYAGIFEGDALDETFEILTDIFVEDDPPNPNLRKPGPRSPLEMMVDRACGIATQTEEP